MDATNPQMSFTDCPSGLVDAQSPGSVHYTASDGESGLDSSASGSVPLSGVPGLHTATTTATDKVGHTATASCTYTVNASPTAPGAPQADPSPNQGAFELTWEASTDPDSNLDHYVLQHKDSGSGAEWSDLATPSSNSHEFTPSDKEAEGTWRYRVIAVDAMGEQAGSEESEPVKVDRSGPNPPSAHTDRDPEDADGGYFKDTVTVSYTDNGDPDLPDGSPGSGVASVSEDQTFNSSGSHAYSGTATDQLGNESEPTQGTVKVDASNPTSRSPAARPLCLRATARTASRSRPPTASPAWSATPAARPRSTPQPPASTRLRSRSPTRSATRPPRAAPTRSTLRPPPPAPRRPTRAPTRAPSSSPGRPPPTPTRTSTTTSCSTRTPAPAPSGRTSAHARAPTPTSSPPPTRRPRAPGATG